MLKLQIYCVFNSFSEILQRFLFLWVLVTKWSFIMNCYLDLSGRTWEKWAPKKKLVSHFPGENRFSFNSVSHMHNTNGHEADSGIDRYQCTVWSFWCLISAAVLLDLYWCYVLITLMFDLYRILLELCWRAAWSLSVFDPFRCLISTDVLVDLYRCTVDPFMFDLCRCTVWSLSVHCWSSSVFELDQCAVLFRSVYCLICIGVLFDHYWYMVYCLISIVIAIGSIWLLPMCCLISIGVLVDRSMCANWSVDVLMFCLIVRWTV